MTPDSLSQLHHRCFVTPPPWSADDFAGFLASPLCFCPSLPQGEGFVLGRAVAGEAELLTIAVAPEARRNGAGRKLMSAFFEAARAHNALSAFLEVAQDNLAARALYRATGWQEVGLRRGYYHTPQGLAVDAVVMRRDLPPSPQL